MNKNRDKMVCGIGVNDADYNVYITAKTGEGNKRKIIWKCPFYIRWANMFRRCYGDKYQERFPTYIGCSVCEDWYYFSNFKAWMEQQDWEEKHLDKDLLLAGNKVYSPETCVFLTPEVNMFTTESDAIRGDYPIGVQLEYTRKDGTVRLRAKCKDVLTGKQRHLGFFDDPKEANQAWLKCKLEQAYILAEQQTDERVAKALINRYENYGAK